jgi:Cu-processing system permease protein
VTAVAVARPTAEQPSAPRHAWVHVARLTVREAVSRRLLLAALILSALFVALFATGLLLAVSSDRPGVLTAGVASVLVTLGLYALHFVALAMAVGAVSSEIESGALHALLARPLSRAAFLIGRWLALAGMIAVYVTAMAGAILLLGRLVVGYQPISAGRTLGLLVAEAVLLLTLALLVSTRLSSVAGGVVVFCLFAISWVAGFIEVIGEVLPNAGMVNLGIGVSLLMPADALWRGASYYSQSPVILAQAGAGGGIPLFGSAPPSTALLAWSAGYVAVCLALALAGFRRRDL